MPPKGWAPPFALEKGTNGQSAESFRFLIRKQLTSHLCMRRGNSDHARKAASRWVACFRVAYGHTSTESPCMRRGNSDCEITCRQVAASDALGFKNVSGTDIMPNDLGKYAGMW